jgi:hypothetical protein
LNLGNVTDTPRRLKTVVRAAELTVPPVNKVPEPPNSIDDIADVAFEDTDGVMVSVRDEMVL